MFWAYSHKLENISTFQKTQHISSHKILDYGEIQFQIIHYKQKVCIHAYATEFLSRTAKIKIGMNLTLESDNCM